MQDYEKLGIFYLGKTVAGESGAQGGELLLYDSRQLTTHAVILGMTGSGKTGLATAMIEEAAIDGIPAILIDPKGDLGNLMLHFPELEAGDFLPWIDEGEAQRRALAPADLAARTAQQWREGLAAWGQDGERIRRLRAAADFAIYTPGSTAGRPLQVLRSFAAPGAAILQDGNALRERVLVAVSGLLGLLGRDADPLQSRDHILLATLLEHAWRAGSSMDLTAIINGVQKPPFEKVGVFDLETFYPARERLGLAMSLNNLLASPGFSAWAEGEALDIQRLLYTPAGKPRVSVLYLAHLSDAERMFFVTVLLNEVLAWMRQQSGTSSLRALLYMDEIFGYFPPNGNPSSKQPMLTLLKQARAFGLGVVLSTQNPVDLDYKGLANCGTWFIGRMQTSQDVARVMAGLDGTAGGTGTKTQRADLERMLAGLGARRFLMRNTNEEQPLLFDTRWVMSYLSGPLTLPQVAGFKPAEPIAAAVPAAVSAAVPSMVDQSMDAEVAAGGAHLPVDIEQCYLRPRQPFGAIIYRPRVACSVKLHFVDARSNIDIWQGRSFVAPFSHDGQEVCWDEAVEYGDDFELDREGLSGAAFAEVPAGALNAKNYTAWGRSLASVITQETVLELFIHDKPKLISSLMESEGDFRVRVANALREERDAAIDKLKQRYATRFQTLNDQIRRASERVEREKAQAGQQKMNAALSMGAALVGAFLGRGVKSVGNIGRVSSAAKNVGKIGKEQADVAAANENLAVLEERLKLLQEQFDGEVSALQQQIAPTELELSQRVIRPRKSDITIGGVMLCWTPWRKAADGALEPA